MQKEEKELIVKLLMISPYKNVQKIYYILFMFFLQSFYKKQINDLTNVIYFFQET